jgi:hypothetical protein
VALVMHLGGWLVMHLGGWLGMMAVLTWPETRRFPDTLVNLGGMSGSPMLDAHGRAMGWSSPSRRDAAASIRSPVNCCARSRARRRSSARLRARRLRRMSARR